MYAFVTFLGDLLGERFVLTLDLVANFGFVPADREDTSLVADFGLLTAAAAIHTPRVFEVGDSWLSETFPARYVLNFPCTYSLLTRLMMRLFFSMRVFCEALASSRFLLCHFAWSEAFLPLTRIRLCMIRLGAFSS